jgi:predicted permease
MDGHAFGYFAVISIATGLVFGIVPALRASRVDLNTALKDGSATGTRRGGRLSGALVVFQFALTLVLLSGAGLMIRSFIEARLINPFVPSEHLLTARVSLPDGKGERYESVDARRKMHDRVYERLSALPGVTGIALTSDMPGLGSQNRDIEIEGQVPKDPKRLPQAAAVFATPSYLPTIGLSLLMGRTFSSTDGLEGREASVVTRAFAARFWPDTSPIGKRFRFITDGKPAAWNTVIGVCGDLVQETMTENPPPLAYFSDRQEPWAWMGILLRTGGDPATVTSSLRVALQDLDPNLPLFEVRTLPAAIDHEYWFLKVFGALFLSFALIALLMASVGVYAVVAQSTSRRTREIGIRMALGASAGRVVRLVLARGLLQLGIGLAAGLGCAILAMRLMHSVPGLSQHGDSLVFVVVGVILIAVGGFACWLPARRAAHVAPTEALRSE